MEFDYETAWHRAAKPLFESLSPEVHALFERVSGMAGDLHQGSKLDVVWPDDGGELRRAFEGFDDADLAVAACAVNAYGHWAPSGAERLDDAGGTWKFSHLADQVLRARLNMPYSSHLNGVSYEVHDGCIRVGVNANWSWSWKAVALATPDNARVVRAAVAAIKDPGKDRRSAPWDAYSDKVMAACDRLRATLLPRDGSPLALTLDTSSFMVAPGTMSIRAEVRRRAAADAKRDLELVAQAVVAVRRAEAAKRAATGSTRDQTDQEIKLLFIGTGTSDDFNQRALARAAELERTKGDSQ